MDIYLNGGFKSGQLVILAARPSVGKTAVMLQMAKAAAAAKNNVQVFSLEMQAEELGERLMYSTGIVTPAQVNFGKTDPSALDQAEKMLNPLPLYINDFSRSLDDIVSRLTQAVKKNRCNIAFIDYLGLMQDALNGGNVKLYQVIARITGTLKAVAKRLQIPIILLCQINRESAREGRSPELFDLRDSGSIEQDADVVLMLESKMTPEQKLYVWLRKNRAGKKEVAFVLTPNKTYSEFTEDGVIMPGEEGVQTPPPDPNHRPLYEYAEERESTEDLPF
jgi:replicative DNA helicase